MHETAQDLELLQQLLDDTYARSGAHLRTILTWYPGDPLPPKYSCGRNG